MIDDERETEKPEVKTWYCIEMPVTDYREVWQLQTDLVQARKLKQIANDLILLVEHPPVFTLGRSGGKDSLKVTEAFLESTGARMVQVERGGSVTYHGPGQIVGYPIIDLHRFRIKVVDYVSALEEVMIRTSAKWGIAAGRNSMNRGIWVDDNKLGSVGVAVRRGVCFHGFALNVNIALEPFSWIHPCGLEGIGVTSFEKVLHHPVSIRPVRDAVKRYVQDVFKIKLIPKTVEQIAETLKTHNDNAALNV